MRLILIALLFSSCSTNDHVIKQVLVDKGPWIRSAEGASLNFQRLDTSYVVSPNFKEKLSMAKKRHDLFLFFGGVVVLAALVTWFIKKGNQGDVGFAHLAVLLAALMACGAAIGGSVDWVHEYETTITKAEYDLNIQTNGDLSAFWAKQPI